MLLSPGEGMNAELVSNSHFVFQLSFPFDTIKSKLQTDSLVSPRYRGSFHCLQKVLEECSILELYHGVSMCLLRAIPGGAVEFFVFELVFIMLGKGTGSFQGIPELNFGALLSRMEKFISSQPELF